MGASGVEIKAAAKRGSAWGTPVACGANDGVLILPHTLKKSRPNRVDDSLGLYFPNESDAGEIAVAGALPAYLRYDGLDLLVALAMGATGGAPSQQGATSAYAQTFTLANNLDGLFATLAVLIGTINVREHPSLKLAGFTLKGEVGKPLEISFDGIADTIDDDSSTNDLTSFGNVTYFETGNWVLFSDGVFRLNDQSGAALGSGDQIYPSSFELTYKRAVRGVYGAGGSSDIIDEPTNDGVPEVSLKLEFPRYTSAAHFSAWDAGTAKKMDLTFTGALIESPYNRQFTVSLPNLKYANVDLPIDRGILTHPVEFNCLGCDSAPTGMTGITLPFQIDVINRKSTDVLA